MKKKSIKNIEKKYSFEINSELLKLYDELNSTLQSVEFNVLDIQSVYFKFTKEFLEKIVGEMIEFVNDLKNIQDNSKEEVDRYSFFILVLNDCHKLLNTQLTQNDIPALKTLSVNLEHLSYFFIEESMFPNYSINDTQQILNYAKIVLFFRNQILGKSNA